MQLVAARVLRVLDGDVEHLGEVLAEAVRRAALDAAPGRRDEALDGRRVQAAGELLLLRLDARDDGDGEELLVDAAVQVEDLEHLLVGLRLGLERRVALLPQELARAQERLCEQATSRTSVEVQARTGETGGRDARGFLNSQRTTEFHWLSLSGRSRCERIHCARASEGVSELHGAKDETNECEARREGRTLA